MVRKSFVIKTETVIKCERFFDNPRIKSEKKAFVKLREILRANFNLIATIFY